MSSGTQEETTFRDIHTHPYWRHRIPLGNGQYTPGRVDPARWSQFGLPSDLSGKTFLDIGAFDGLLSFEAERRGAERVLATDIWSSPVYDDDWWDDLRPGKRGFDMAHSYLDSSVESREISLQQITPETVGTFDIVLCSNVIHHLKEPYTGVENLVDVADELLVIGGYTADQRLFKSPKPEMEFMKVSPEGGAWWTPNLRCVEEMMTAAGVSSTKSIYFDRHRETELPDTERREVVADDVRVYKDPEMTNEIDTVAAGTSASVLYRHEGSHRIEYTVKKQVDGCTGIHQRQGWVDPSCLEEPSPGSGSLVNTDRYQRLAKTGIDTIFEEGIDRFLGDLSLYLRGKRLSGVAHGHV